MSSILIIGAGASGIAAATKLYENGFQNLTILEAENRIGGRIKTIPFGDNVIDMGAQWCHGEVGNVVYDMAAPHNLLQPSLVDVADGFEYRYINGEKADTNITKKLDELAFRIADDENHYQYNGNYGDFVIETVNKEINEKTEYQNIDKQLVAEYLKTFEKFSNSSNASDTWRDLSSKMDFEFPEGNRALNWKDKGYATVFDLLTKKIPNPELRIPIEDKVIFNKKVVEILWNREGNSGVQVKCNDLSEYIADHVIVTVSLGVLLENYKTLFSPALPQSKQNAIEGLKLGSVAKIYLEFEEAFWPSDFLGFAILWKENVVNDLKKQYGNWIEDILGFFTFDVQSKTLCAWISGLPAKEMEAQPDDVVKAGCMTLLRLCCPEFTIPDPKTFIRSDWYTNQNFRGTYSYRSLKSDELNVWPRDLAEPVLSTTGKLALQFAGEATHSIYYSTVNGAIESGWREAQRIIDSYKK